METSRNTLIKKTYFVAIIFCSFFFKFQTAHATDVCGDRSGLWTLANSPYEVTCDVRVPNGETLTIEGGVTVMFHYSTKLYVQGTLRAEGAVDNKIVFTSIEDDGVGPDPMPGDWDCIDFYHKYFQVEGTLQHCIVKYGGSSGNGNINIRGQSYGAIVDIQHTLISHSSNYAISLTGTFPTYSNITLEENRYNGIAFKGQDLQGVYGIDQDGTLRNPSGYPYIIPIDSTIAPNVTVTIEHGVIVKFAFGVQLQVNGILRAEGAVDNKIVFTSLADPDYGGDTDGDGPDPMPGDWDCIDFYQQYASAEGTLQHCIVKYGGSSGKGNIAIRGYSYGAIVDIQDSLISHSSNYPIFLTKSYPTYSNIIFENNVYNGIAFQGVNGNIVNESGILRDPSGYPYIIPGNIRIEQNVGLTIDPGVVIKFASGVQMHVEGTLWAVGDAANKIVFTSLADPDYGGDTDGVGPDPMPGDWERILFHYQYGIPGGRLEHCIVRYGGSSGNGNIGVNEGSPCIQDCCIRDSQSAGILIENSAGPILGDSMNPECNGCNDIINNGTYAIENQSSNNIKAENIWFGTTDAFEIDSLIFDFQDDPNFGEIDYVAYLESSCGCLECTGSDVDQDGLPDMCDNCDDTSNGPNGGTCTAGESHFIARPCTDNSQCGIDGFCSMHQEDTDEDGIGDACDLCTGDLDCDDKCDAIDVTIFLEHFGRNPFNRPCTNDNDCPGDFFCDKDVDADDVPEFLKCFGRSPLNNPCPPCVFGPWCIYEE